MGQRMQAGGAGDAVELLPIPVNEVRLWPSVLAYNLTSPWRLVLPNWISNWSLANPQQRSVKTRGGLVKHARYY